MTTALWTLLAFAGWTIFVLAVGVGTRRWYLILFHKAGAASFPGDTPHGSTAYRRAVRAHANCVENLPVYAAIVLTAEVARLVPAQMDMLALVVIVCRIVQSSIHMLLPETNMTVGFRFTFFFAQVAAMIWMIASIASLAAARAG